MSYLEIYVHYICEPVLIIAGLYFISKKLFDNKK